MLHSRIMTERDPVTSIVPKAAPQDDSSERDQQRARNASASQRFRIRRKENENNDKRTIADLQTKIAHLETKLALVHSDYLHVLGVVEQRNVSLDGWPPGCQTEGFTLSLPRLETDRNNGSSSGPWLTTCGQPASLDPGNMAPKPVVDTDIMRGVWTKEVKNVGSTPHALPSFGQLTATLPAAISDHHPPTTRQAANRINTDGFS